ncbi:Calcium-binding protein, partial [Spraguea lophii 42_110]
YNNLIYLKNIPMGNKISTIPPQENINDKFSHFTPQELEEWNKSFNTKFPNGYITSVDLEKILHSLFPFGNPSKFSSILFRTINISGNKTIDYNELLIAFSILNKGSHFERLRWVYRFYDIDNDGIVSKKEMLTVVQSIFDMTSHTFNMKIDVIEFIDRIFKELENQSGFLTFEDFKRLSVEQPEFFKRLWIDI